MHNNYYLFDDHDLYTYVATLFCVLHIFEVKIVIYRMAQIFDGGKF